MEAGGGDGQGARSGGETSNRATSPGPEGDSTRGEHRRSLKRAELPNVVSGSGGNGLWPWQDKWRRARREGETGHPGVAAEIRCYKSPVRAEKKKTSWSIVGASTTIDERKREEVRVRGEENPKLNPRSPCQWSMDKLWTRVT